MVWKISHCGHDLLETCLFPTRSENGYGGGRTEVRLACRAKAQDVPPSSSE